MLYCVMIHKPRNMAQVQTVNLRSQVYEDLTAVKGKRDSYSDAIEDLLLLRIENEKLKEEIKKLKEAKKK